LDFISILRGLKSVGFGNVARSFAYARRRDRADAQFGAGPTAGPRLLPGSLQSVELAATGGSLVFENAQLQVDFLCHDVVSFTWTPGELPLPYSLAEADWQAPSVEHGESPERHLFSTKSLQVEIGVGGAVRIGRDSGAMLWSCSPPVRTGSGWELKSELSGEEQISGLGERTAPLNLRPGKYRAWNREPMGAYGAGDDPVYVCVPAYIGLRREGSYLLYFENSFDGEFAFGGEAVTSFVNGALRYYFIPGPPSRALERFTKLTGRPALPPKWSLGYHQARWSYMNDGEVRELVEGFESRDLPLDVVHLDIHYMDEYRVFTVDDERFPDLTSLAADLDDCGVKLVAILDPGVKVDPDWDVYREGVSRQAFMKYPDGREVHAPVWPGECVFPDFSDPGVREWWGALYQRFVDWGIAGIWHDMNEPSAFAAWGEATLPLSSQQAFDGRGGSQEEGHNLYALLEAMAGHEGLRKLRPECRPWILSRSGWAGMQRYAWNWTGDNESTWWTVHQSLRIALGMGLSGLPYTGPDIGGFGGNPPAELYSRWFQLASFLPFFRTHCAVFTPRREPWVFGEPTLAIVRGCLHLRRKLMPYFYTLAWEASQTGAPLVRPMFWPDAEDPALWAIDDQFFLGDVLLVAPILKEAAVSRRVVLPEGRWYRLSDDAIFDGPAEVDCEAPLDTIPVFVRGGSVLPLEDDGCLQLHVYAPHGGKRRSQVYLDAGDGYGEGRVESYEVLARGDGARITRDCRGAFRPDFARIELHLHGFAENSSVVADGVVVMPDGALAVVAHDFQQIEVRT